MKVQLSVLLAPVLATQFPQEGRRFFDLEIGLGPLNFDLSFGGYSSSYGHGYGYDYGYGGYHAGYGYRDRPRPYYTRGFDHYFEVPFESQQDLNCETSVAQTRPDPVPVRGFDQYFTVPFATMPTNDLVEEKGAETLEEEFDSGNDEAAVQPRGWHKRQFLTETRKLELAGQKKHAKKQKKLYKKMYDTSSSWSSSDYKHYGYRPYGGYDRRPIYVRGVGNTNAGTVVQIENAADEKLRRVGLLSELLDNEALTAEHREVLKHEFSQALRDLQSASESTVPR
ncbi:MAG: hypothetical protein MHM6MM_004284 [Cercozoa sp. M6MM]